MSVYKYFKTVAKDNNATAWKSKSLSDNSLNPGINPTYNAKIQVKFDGSCSKQENVSLTHN